MSIMFELEQNDTLQSAKDAIREMVWGGDWESAIYDTVTITDQGERFSAVKSMMEKIIVEGVKAMRENVPCPPSVNIDPEFRQELENMTRRQLIELNMTQHSLIEERERVTRLIPECPQHGHCIPHAIAWVKIKKMEDDNEA